MLLVIICLFAIASFLTLWICACCVAASKPIPPASPTTKARANAVSAVANVRLSRLNPALLGRQFSFEDN
jgi:hypothetical protein